MVLCEEARHTLSSPPLSLTSFGSVAVVGNELMTGRDRLDQRSSSLQQSAIRSELEA